MDGKRNYLFSLMISPLLVSCSPHTKNLTSPRVQLPPSAITLKDQAVKEYRKMNQLVDDIEVLGLMYEEKRYKEVGDKETAAKYTQLIGDRIPKILTLEDKLYFESQELLDSLQNLSPLELQSNWKNIIDLNRDLEQIKRDNYKPPISRENWIRAYEIYSKSLDGKIS